MIDVSENRAFLLKLLVITIVFSGIRFSDGSMLMAISEGADTSHEVFSPNPDAQYVFDSPLKVYILRLLPSNLIVISAFFAILSALPLALLLFPSLTESQRSVLLIYFLLTPVLAISFQNIGVGDGLIISLCLIATLSQKRVFYATSIFFICIWHPQQSFFIVLSILIYDYTQGPSSSKRFIPIIISATLGFFVYIIYNFSLNFEFASRADYMASNSSSIIYSNFLKLPFFAAPLLAILYLCWPALKALDSKYIIVFLTYAFVVFLLSSLTTDFTRVFFILTTPIIIYLIKNTNISVKSSKFLACYAVTLLSPVVSWSGLDILLYRDFFRDICKWGVACF